MQKPIFAVCAGGRAGAAMAADMALMGYKVNLFELERYKENIDPIIEKGGIELSGKTQSGRTGFAKLNRVTSDPEEAIKDADLIMVTSPAIGHEAFFEAFSPYLREGQCVLVNTGCWASLRMAPILTDLNVFEKITMAEANIMPYLSDKQEYRAQIINVKQDIRLATFPGDRKSRIFDIIQLVYPQHKRVPNVLWTNFAPGNPSVHAPIALPMTGLMLERNETSRFYAEATTCAARLCEAFDKERTAIASSLGCDVETAFQYAQKAYGYTGKDIADAYRNSPHAERSIPRERIRVILEEDLAFFYVPLVQLGKLLGISTPISQGIIEIMGAMLNINYWEKGVTVEQLGFAGLSAEQIVRYVNRGSK